MLAVGFAAAPAQAAPTVTADVKVYAFIVKKHDISDAEFHAHWRHPHGDLTKKVPQIKRYLQNHGVGNPAALEGVATMPYLGIATIWVADVGKLGEIFNDPGFQDVHADELNLLERGELSWLVAQETVVTAGPRPGDAGYQPTKALLFVKRAPGTSPAAFQSGLEAAALYAGRAVRNARVVYAVPHPAAGADSKPPYDGVLELAVRDDATFARAWAANGVTLAKILAPVVEAGATRGFLAHERRVIWPPLH